MRGHRGFRRWGLALPADLVARLKLRQLDTVRIYTLDEGEYQYRVYGIVELEVRGRTYHVKASELPRAPNRFWGPRC